MEAQLRSRVSLSHPKLGWKVWNRDVVFVCVSFPFLDFQPFLKQAMKLKDVTQQKQEIFPETEGSRFHYEMTHY